MGSKASGRVLILGTLLGVGLFCGCDSGPTGPAAATVDWFAPTQMRIHPIFTQLANWTHNTAKPDGIEAQLEFTDQFNDPTKASGQVLFELYEYRRDVPNSRGKRLAYWVGSLASIDEQRARWNTTLRTYRFQLVDPVIQLDQSYVLIATFERTGGNRFPSSSIVLPARIDNTKDHKRQGLQQELNVGTSGPTSQPDTTQP